MLMPGAAFDRHRNPLTLPVIQGGSGLQRLSPDLSLICPHIFLQDSPCLPRVLQESVTPEMGFYRISSLEDLQPGYRGILEPSGDGEEYLGGQGREERPDLSLICPHIFLQDSPWNRQDAPP